MNENNRRLLVTVALCMGVALAWSFFFNPAPKTRETLETSPPTVVPITTVKADV